MLLSAALIVRNEARTLGECLSSIVPLIDEIIVVDTGSTDETPDIAAKFKAVYSQFAWRDDFSAARNRALDLAHGEWILYIDADERIVSGSAEKLRASLTDPLCAGLEVLLRPRPGLTPYWILRLFRNHPSIRFRGIIHENIWPAMQEFCESERCVVSRCDLLLQHEGYEGDQQHKHARNLPLLLKSLAIDPSRIYCWCHLADIRLQQGEPKLAKECWQSALNIVRARRTASPDDVMPYLGLIQQLGRELLDTAELLNEAIVRFPTNAQLHWLAGRQFMRARQYLKAIPFFERLIRWGETGEYDHSSSWDEVMFTTLPYESLAICHFRLAKYGESLRCYEAAAKFNPGRREYLVKQSLCRELNAAKCAESGQV